MFQASILEWIAISFSKGSSHLSDWTYICIAGRFFTTEPPGKPAYTIAYIENLKECTTQNRNKNLIRSYKWTQQDLKMQCQQQTNQLYILAM